MQLEKLLAFVVPLLTKFAAGTKTTADDMLLSMLMAVQESPQMLAFLQGLFDAIKPGTHATIDPNDPALAKAFEASPAMKSWELRRRRVEGDEVGDPGKEKLGLAGIAGLLKYLPILIEIWKAYKASGLGTPAAENK